MAAETRAHRDHLQPAALDRRVAAAASGQWGNVTTAQLRSLGATKDAIARRVAAGRLHREHRGVFSVGCPALGIEAQAMAAVLACGPGAALAGEWAARHWGLLRLAEGSPEVLVPHGRRGPPTVRTVSCRAHARRGTTVHRAIPVLAIPDVLLDLAARSGETVLRRAVAEAQFLRLYDEREMRVLLDRCAHLPGARVVRDLVADPALGENELERAFRRLCRRAGVPAPQSQVRIPLGPGRHARVDFLWPDRRLVVETDGREGHLTPAAFEADRARDAALTALGLRVVRFTHRQVREGGGVTATLQALLG